MEHANFSRRDFLKTVGLTAGAVSLGGYAKTLMQSSQAMLQADGSKLGSPLPSPKFYWGVGIENTWMAQTDPVKDGNRRLLDEFLQLGHYDRWQEDLDLAKAVGVNAIRYSVPWYKAEASPGVYDWSWIDKPVEYLVNKLKIIPIMDILHYGTPTWMADGVIDARFPDAVAKYAGAMAAHFKGLVNHYSPANEPAVNCSFCGISGYWPPYQKSVNNWARIGVQIAKGMSLETEAIRQAIPDSVIVSVDPFGYVVNDPNQDVRDASAMFPGCLVYGKVQAGHPFADFLIQHGISSEEIAWFAQHVAKPDILGYNNYPGFSSTLPLEQAAKAAADNVKSGILRAYSYYNLPVYLTETSAGLTTQAKIAYINALYNMTKELRGEGVPFVGINWWPLFTAIQWAYREQYTQPLTNFLTPGGWNNGLYVINVQPSGELRRMRTPAADAYQAMLGCDLAKIGK